MISICIYVLFIFICDKNIIKTQPGLEMSFQTKIREYFSDFLGLNEFLRLEETVYWSKPLIFDRTSSNWQCTIRMNTKMEESKIFEAET